MALVSTRDLKKIIHVHYIINLFLAISYILFKSLRPFCDLLFKSCTLDYEECEILFFVAVIIVSRTRKQGAVNFLPYISTACMLAKIGNVILFFFADPFYGILYVVLCLLHLLLCPEPSYQGPDNIIYFTGEDLEEELKKKSSTVWLIELFAAWNPACVDFASTFAEISANFGLDNLKFGKVDLTRSPETAAKYKINTSPLSKQIPTLILFKNGEEMKRPLVTSNGKLIPFALNYDNVVNTFELHSIYQECKQELAKQKSKVKSNHTKAD